MTDTKLNKLIQNILTKEQFEGATVSPNEQYYITDDDYFATKDDLSSKQDVITDLDNIRNNIATNTSNISYLDGKVRDIELFKFPNAVIIGEPTISNGQVSGFSSENYMQFPFILDLHNTPFQIDFAFTTGNDVTTQQNILDSEFGLALAIANGKGLMAISSNGTSWDIGSSVGSIAIQPNTTYYARLTWNGMQYKTLISTNGTDYVQDMYLVGVQRPYPRTIFIGGCSGSAIAHTPHPFFGSINMNKAYLSTNGNVIWQGMDDAGLATRADISLSNLDELGEKRFTDLQNALDSKVGFTDYASGSNAGVIKTSASTTFQVDENGIPYSPPRTLNQYTNLNNSAFIGKGTLENIKENLVTSIGDTKYQNKLVSGTNIKTINGESVLGNGDLEIKSSSYHPPILSCMWSDHLINDMRWLRADTFSWQSGDVYATAYNTLVEEYQLVVIPEETEGGVTFKRSSNGYKIADASQEVNILTKYNSDGIAWYYILDTANKRFKLPRTKFGFEGLRTNVGDDIAESLPNIKGSIEIMSGAVSGNWYPLHTMNSKGALSPTRSDSNAVNYSNPPRATGDVGIAINASDSSSTYQDNAPVQERATQMYLYFYVGEYTREAIEQTAGITTEQLNNKVDVSTFNTLSENVENIDNRIYLKTTYVSGTSGYNIWSNGYCEQWGRTATRTSDSSLTITFTKKYKNSNVNVTTSIITSSRNNESQGVFNITANGFSIQGWNQRANDWKACGYLAEGEY